MHTETCCDSPVDLLCTVEPKKALVYWAYKVLPEPDMHIIERHQIDLPSTHFKLTYKLTGNGTDKPYLRQNFGVITPGDVVAINSGGWVEVQSVTPL